LLAIAKTTLDRIPALERFTMLLSEDHRAAAAAAEKR
jgi:hypothetical protein